MAQIILLKFFDLISEVAPYQPGTTYSRSNQPSLFVCFTSYYDVHELPMESPEPLFERTRVVGQGRNNRTKTIMATAIVMDPVNPTNNLWLTLADPSVLVNRAAKAAEDIIEEH
jgi:hypothetical protein